MVPNPSILTPQIGVRTAFPACDPFCNPLILNTPKGCAHGFSSLRPVLEVIDFKRFCPVCAPPYVLHTYEPALWRGGLK